MRNVNKRKRIVILPLYCTCVLLASCQSSPTRIDSASDRAVTSMGVDYNELVEWAQTLTERMIQDGFLDAPEYQPHPVKMVISNIENKTDISQLPKEIVLGHVRAALRSSGKVRYVSTYGSDATDNMTRDSQDLKNDPLFDSSQVPRAGQASVARLSLNTQFLFHSARTKKARQNTYRVRMFVNDTAIGEIVWEGFSDPIIKVSKRRSIGL